MFEEAGRARFRPRPVRSETSGEGSSSKMLKRLYVNNFRCLVAFEMEFDPFVVLCGPNGAGKSSVFDVIGMLRHLAAGDAVLGSDGPQDIRKLELTEWLDSKVQEFEIDFMSAGHRLGYKIHIEQVSRELKPRVRFEEATCDGRILYQRDLDGIQFSKADRTRTGFPLDWRQAALGAIQPAGDRREIELLQRALSSVAVIRPSPRVMQPESKGESRSPTPHLENLLSWYRFLSQEQEWTDALRGNLRDVWPDFRSFKLEDVGMNSKALQLRFDAPGGAKPAILQFHQLADGEKALVGLYMIHAAIDTGALETVLIDEPDNYVGLPELQPWVLAMRELLDDTHQAILISHHPEILGNAGRASGRYLWRDHHGAPTRSGPLEIPDGLTAGEALARGWVHG